MITRIYDVTEQHGRTAVFEPPFKRYTPAVSYFKTMCRYVIVDAGGRAVYWFNVDHVRNLEDDAQVLIDLCTLKWGEQ